MENTQHTKGYNSSKMVQEANVQHNSQLIPCPRLAISSTMDFLDMGTIVETTLSAFRHDHSAAF